MATPESQVGRLPPQSVEAERSVLGSMLIESEAIPCALTLLHPEDFYRDAHRAIYEAMVHAFARAAPAPRAGVQLAFFPPFPILEAVSRLAGVPPDASVGAQNCHWEEAGAFTGEVSAAMLREAGAEYVIVGHSERRQLFGETDDGVARKVAAAMSAGPGRSAGSASSGRMTSQRAWLSAAGGSPAPNVDARPDQSMRLNQSPEL